MDKVRLLNKLLKEFQYIEDAGGYVNGIWVKSLEVPVTFKAAPFPVSEKDLRLFPEGALSIDDVKLYTKYDLSTVIDKTIKRVLDSQEYRLFQGKPYQEMADLKVYILKKWTGES